jgi:hypothetical protein
MIFVKQKKYSITELKTKIQSLTDELLNTCFRDLKTFHLEIKFYTNAYTFFETTIQKFYLSAKKRKYIILVNTQLCYDHPTPEAIKAILAHELIHIRDYTKSSTLQLLQLAFMVHWFTTFNTQYERSIDLRSLDYNFHDGLAEYREWLYERIPKKLVAAKQRDYLTPAEIRNLIK